MSFLSCGFYLDSHLEKVWIVYKFPLEKVAIEYKSLKQQIYCGLENIPELHHFILLNQFHPSWTNVAL